MKSFIFILLAALALAEAKKINFCYYPDYGSNVVKPANIKAEYCTHIGYSFFKLDPDGTCSLADPGWEGNIIRELITKKSANTKICPVIGGYGRSWMFGTVAASPQSRKRFVVTCGALLKEFGFDNCFDVDWEFPTEAERGTFVSLLQDIKSGMPGVELFTAVSAGLWQAGISYNIPEIAKTVDYINLMTYDYHGSWESTTGMNSPLTAPPGDTLNIKSSVDYFIANGAPANKLLLGVPFYGRTFGLVSAASTTPGSPSTGGEGIEYFNICKDKSWNIKYDTTYQVPYAVKGNTWLSFDNEMSIAAKTKFVNDRGLGGTLIWSIQQDDTTGACGGGAWPLLTAVYKGLNGQSPVPGPVTTTSKPITKPPILATTTIKPPTQKPPVPTPAPSPSPPPKPIGSVGGEYLCPKVDGYYVDTFKCSQYHYCLGGYDMGLQNCPAGTYFVNLPGGNYNCESTSPYC